MIQFFLYLICGGIPFGIIYWLLQSKFYAMLVTSGVFYLMGYFKGGNDVYKDCVGGFKNED